MFYEEIKAKHPKLKTIFELGCHRGQDCLEIGKHWPESKVYGFEADPYNYKLAKERLKYDKKMFVENYAVSNISGLIPFYRYDDVESILDKNTFEHNNFQTTAQGSILPLGRGMVEEFGKLHVFQTLEIPAITLSDYCKNNKIRKIDALFMDVQGAEFQCLLGCGKLLDTIDVIVFEWSMNKVMYSGETDYKSIKMFLEFMDFTEILRIDQTHNMTGDSLFFKNKRKKWRMF